MAERRRTSGTSNSETWDCFRTLRWLLAATTHFTTNASALRDDLLNLQAMPQLEVLCMSA